MAAEAKRRRWWASIGIGAAICIGCCLAPLLAAVGIAGSGIALLGLSWLEPLGFALIAVGAVGLVWSRMRTARSGCRSRGTTGGCGGGSCECGTAVSTDGAKELPLLSDPPRSQ